ncbi:glycosyltransferase [Flavobacteriaceae bacterium F89]|uniref:Glycosyltransferase n=1 Tax=Cerina litoralis TaxID=2874477 RepID=A0AAE3JPZ6_9FLAO|nr:glycosyltransferase [Cerina litoralis]MCG2459688.1 glycosyltransferase [Cerina litoralis]
MPLPKVLILNQPFNTNTGGGITLSNLFAKWDGDRLAVACSGYLLTEDMDPMLCNTYYQLGSEERKWIFPLNVFSRNYYSGSIKITESVENKNKVVVRKSKLREKLVMNYVLPFLEYIGFDYFKAKSKLSYQFCKWLDDFDPDVLYMQASSRESILFCTEIIKYKRRPMIFHMMDDWPALIGVRGLLSKFWERKINKEFQFLIEQATLRMSISDYMAQAYYERYGQKFVTFHNPIDLEFWKRSQRDSCELNLSPVVMYAGRIGLGIDESLKTIAEALEMVNVELGTSVKFVIQAQESPTWVKNFKNVEHRCFVAYEELPKIFAQADILLLPYDFSKESLSYIKYSMPTKAPEYMASGTPILVFAPLDTALVQYAKEYKWAALVTENKVTTLAKCFKELLLHQSVREKITQTAKKIAENRHEVNQVTRNFQQAILKVAANKMKAEVQ